MQQILEALANDNLCINPDLYKDSPEYRKVTTVLYKTAEYLSKKMDDDGKKIFEQFRDAQSDESHIHQVDMFIRGYRLGVLMMIEVFAGASDLTYNEGGQKV